MTIALANDATLDDLIEEEIRRQQIETRLDRNQATPQDIKWILREFAKKLRHHKEETPVLDIIAPIWMLDIIAVSFEKYASGNISIEQAFGIDKAPRRGRPKSTNDDLMVCMAIHRFVIEHDHKQTQMPWQTIIAHLYRRYGVSYNRDALRKIWKRYSNTDDYIDNETKFIEECASHLA